MRLEQLEARDVPSTLVVDKAGGAGVFTTIQAAVTASADGDTIQIHPSATPYGESVNVNKSVTLVGTGATPADVVVDSSAGPSIQVAASTVTISNLTASGAATDGISSTTTATTLTLDTVNVTQNGGAGLNLTASGVVNSRLTLINVTDTGNAGAGLTVTQFSNVDITGMTLNSNPNTSSSITTIINGTVTYTATTDTTPYTVTTGQNVGTLQFNPTGGTAGDAITLNAASMINLTGGGGTDHFVINPNTGTRTLTLNGNGPTLADVFGQGVAGDILDLTTYSQTSFPTLAASASGFSGSVSKTSNTAFGFSGFEHLIIEGATAPSPSTRGAVTISGTVFNDTNQNGVQDGTETLAPGVTVTADFGADGTPEFATMTQASLTPLYTQPASSWNWLFDGLFPGVYQIRVVPPPGQAETLPPLAPTSDLTLGTDVFDIKRGIAPSTSPPTSTVKGFVYADVSPRNGVRDGSEPGVSGITVYLDLNNNGQIDGSEPTAITDGTGAYTLTTTQTSAAAAVRVVLSPGYLVTATQPTFSVGTGTVTTADIGLISALPPQATPSRQFATGTVTGGQAHVTVFNSAGTQLFDRAVFAGLTMTDVRVASADLTGDGVDDIIVGTGPGTATQVIVLDGTNLQQIATIAPFEAAFTGGVYVAAGDLTGDGINDLIVTPDQGGGPRILVYRGGAAGASGSFTQIASFFGIDDPNFRGGARAAVVDMNRDGTPDLIVAAGFGGGPRVAVYDGKTALTSLNRLFNDFFIFEQTLRNGAFITAGDLDGDGFADLIGGGGPGGAPRVLALSGADLLAGKGDQSQALVNFFAGDQNDRGGVRVSAKDVNGDGRAEIFTGSGDGTRGTAREFSSTGQDLGFQFQAPAGNTSGIFVG